MNRHQRHLGRELALLWLYQIDLGHANFDDTLTTIPEGIEGVEDEALIFGQALARGIREHRTQLDQGIVKYARGWSLTRMAVIERNILRISLYELQYLPDDIPTSVSVDEAVELAKTYGAEESGRFVNGILGAFIRGDLHPPASSSL
jgi:N utilization substance protein B